MGNYVDTPFIAEPLTQEPVFSGADAPRVVGCR
jgi:hypothetical protein